MTTGFASGKLVRRLIAWAIVGTFLYWLLCVPPTFRDVMSPVPAARFPPSHYETTTTTSSTTTTTRALR